MTRTAGTIALIVVAVWLIAHLLYIGPVQAAAEVTMLWALGIAAASVGVAALVLLAVGLTLGGSRPAWLRFVRGTRTASAVLGCALVVVGLLYYRDFGQVHWIVLGLAVLVGAGLVHGWVLYAQRKLLT
jgi:hypothetical protein